MSNDDENVAQIISQEDVNLGAEEVLYFNERDTAYNGIRIAPGEGKPQFLCFKTRTQKNYHFRVYIVVEPGNLKKM